MKGTIIRMMPKQGVGFLKTQYDDEVVFDKFALEGYGFEDFKIGDTVTFDLEEGPKGPRAVHIRMSI